MSVKRAYLLVLVVWIHLGDFAAAWVYQGGALPEVGWARVVRDMTVILAACLCLATVRIARSLLLPFLIYGLLIFLSLATSAKSGVPIGVLVGSFGTLLIPMLFFLVGYYCVRDPADIQALVACLVIIACLSAIFGAWDIHHTEFWTQTIQFPAYMADVKGMVYGAEPETGLPYNFFIDLDQTRRAAGLLAAPLAQGMVLAVAGVLVVAAGPARLTASRVLIFLLILLGLCAGVWMSGTRGAMLAGTIALTGYLLTSRASRRHPLARLIAAAAVVLVIGLATRDVVDATINQTDGSSPGHWAAFQRNIDGLFQIPALGYGIGRQGPVAAQAAITNVGGGEGAVFSVAYQSGVLAALALLIFYAVCLRRLWRADREHQAHLALAVFWLMIGFATTLVTSDHMLSVSGSASLWLLTGGAMRLLSRAQERPDAAAEAAA
ncbi:hypothetical protein WHZ77_03020 [Bradyrhizobium sp. A5]|uniref:hypothetical protein n=1 Tax=Bradyrhizobium sp. A5 TaxID=3133696 RepID=UPI00324DE662